MNKRFGSRFLPHFSYGSWYETYIRDSMPKIGESIRDLYNYDLVQHELESGVLGTEEKSWHRYTSMIMFDNMIHYYNL